MFALGEETMFVV